MAGKLYGVGVGPGDPELLTLKAVRIIENCQVIAVPGEIPEESVAWQIIEKAGIRDLEEKKLMGISMPMTKDKKKLLSAHEKGNSDLKMALDQGEDLAFLTLGDPTVYSTYMYLHHEIGKLGYQTEIINGVPSFCAAAAKAGIELGKGAEQIHVIPASYQMEEALDLPGTRILMKSGREYPKVKKSLERSVCKPSSMASAADMDGKSQHVVMVENCGMESEKIYDGIENLPEEAGYYTLIIIKDEV